MANEIIRRAVSKIPIRALTAVILTGLAAMLVLIPVLSAMGGFTVTFETDGGSSVSAQRLRYGEHVMRPADPTREGYTFVGWYEDDAGKKAFDFTEQTVQGSATLYAIWSEQ